MARTLRARTHYSAGIAINVEIRTTGEIVDRGGRSSFFIPPRTLSQALYVDPRTGLIRLNKDYRQWRKRNADRRERKKADRDDVPNLRAVVRKMRLRSE